MTTEEKRTLLYDYCMDRDCGEECPLFVDELKCGRGEHFLTRSGRMSDEDVDLAYNLAFPNHMEVKEEPHILDSGTRREFDTGAVRDIQEGKGRCDLMPLDVVSEILNNGTICFIHAFQQTGDYNQLIKTLLSCAVFSDQADSDPCWMHTMFLEVSKHFEEGAKKYGEHNWQKGIPIKCYIDSAVRHYLKWLRGDNDEPHDRAFVWNILCCIWTCIHKPELNDYRKENNNENNA